MSSVLIPHQRRLRAARSRASGESGVCATRHAWARVPVEPTPTERAALKDRIRQPAERAQRGDGVALLRAPRPAGPGRGNRRHRVSDSLEMARFGRDHAAQTLVVSGVRFMGETAKILSPEKRVLMPDLDATCSLDLGCPIDEFSAFCDAHPDRTVVVYANTSAAVKARADWVVTSSCALDIVRALKEQGQKILWAPDRHLGGYIQRETGADMVMWNGACIVHDEFKAFELQALMKEHPLAKVLVHPESPGRRGGAGRRGGLDLGHPEGGARDGRARIHRRHRQRHDAQAAHAQPRQDLHRSAHGRQQRHLQELRALPLDGDERPGRAWRRCWKPARTKSMSTRRWACAPACRLTACWLSRPR